MTPARRPPSGTYAANAARLYAAERLVKDPWVTGSIAASQAEIDRILSDPWWAAEVPWAPQVTVRRGRSRRFGAYAYPERTSIAISVPWWGPRLLLHELAHYAARRGGHGAHFAERLHTLLGRFVDDPLSRAYGWPPGRIPQLRFEVGCALFGVAIEPAGVPVLPPQLSISLPEATDAVELALCRWLHAGAPGANGAGAGLLGHPSAPAGRQAGQPSSGRPRRAVASAAQPAAIPRASPCVGDGPTGRDTPAGRPPSMPPSRRPAANRPSGPSRRPQGATP